MGYVSTVVFLVLLWMRPEYRFVLFYVVANTVLVVLISVWGMPPGYLPAYVLILAFDALGFVVLGIAVVALRKWLKTRQTGRDKQLDKDMALIRTELSNSGRLDSRS